MRHGHEEMIPFCRAIRLEIIVGRARFAAFSVLAEERARFVAASSANWQTHGSVIGMRYVLVTVTLVILETSRTIPFPARANVRIPPTAVAYDGLSG